MLIFVLFQKMRSCLWQLPTWPGLVVHSIVGILGMLRQVQRSFESSSLVALFDDLSLHKSN